MLLQHSTDFGYFEILSIEYGTTMAIVCPRELVQGLFTHKILLFHQSVLRLRFLYKINNKLVVGRHKLMLY